jgi:proteasome accessory factor C
MERDEVGARKVDPYHLLFQGGQFYLLGRSHERDAIRVFRLSRIRGKVAYATKAEHDFRRPADFDPRPYAHRAVWQFGEPEGTAEVWVSERIAWQVERHFGRFGRVEPVGDGAIVLHTDYAVGRLLAAWVLGLGEHAHVQAPADLAEEVGRRAALVAERHEGPFDVADAIGRPAAPAREADPDGAGGRRDAAIRPERFARLVTLASVLIAAGRAGERLQVKAVCEQLKMSPQELREDVSVLNVVNFGGGAYVIYAEVLPSGEIEVDPEPYSDTFDRPARLLPIEAKALVAAIDLIGLAHAELRSAREKVVDALGFDPVEEGLHIVSPIVHDDITHTVELAVHENRLLELEYWTQTEDRYSERVVEPYALFNGREAWYVAAWDVERGRLQHFRLDRIKRAAALLERFEPREGLNPIADVGGWPRTGRIGGSRTARVKISAGQARWVREQRAVLAELPDGEIIVEFTFKSLEFLVREVLKEAGDAIVLEPADAREAVLAAAERLVVRAT